jgi:hypothetical protein
VEPVRESAPAPESVVRFRLDVAKVAFDPD